MALFDGISTLEDVLGKQAETASMGLDQSAAKKRRQAIAQQAQAGRLGSGVANYTLADLDSEEIGGMGDIQSRLAEALGQIPSEDFVRQNEYQRQEQLAKLIGSLNKRSKVGSILGGIGTGAGTGAAVGGPWGALIGGSLGGVLGGMD